MDSDRASSIFRYRDKSAVKVRSLGFMNFLAGGEFVEYSFFKTLVFIRLKLSFVDIFLLFFSLGRDKKQPRIKHLN